MRTMNYRSAARVLAVASFLIAGLANFATAQSALGTSPPTIRTPGPPVATAPPAGALAPPPAAPAPTSAPAPSSNPAAADAAAPRSAAAPAGKTPATPASTGSKPTGAKVTKGSGTLPNNHGQIWREYDISPYTSRIANTTKPEQAIIDWILRETGPEVWFTDPFGILNADKTTLRVYHTPEMHQLVSGIVDRFVSSEGESQVLGLRLATVGSPNWRTRAYAWLRPVEVKTPGIEAWLLSKENATILVAELSRRADYREFNSPNLVVHNGQSQTVSRLRPKQYVKSVRPRDAVLAGYDTEMGQVDEGVSLQVSPLFSLDGRAVDVLVKCHVDQVEKLVPVSIDLPGFGGQWQRAQIQVPQVVSWRLHERFRWPSDQVLLLSCGVVAAPAPESNKGAAALLGALSTTPGRADALLFVECNGKAQVAAAPPENRPNAPLGTSYKGRY